MYDWFLKYNTLQMLDKIYLTKGRSLFSLFLLGTCLLLASCDCVQRLAGQVIDAETKRPLSGVYYGRSPLNDEDRQAMLLDSLPQDALKTDSSGLFSAGQMANGFTCKPHLVLWFEKPGYERTSLEWMPKQSPKDSLIVVLRPRK